MNLGFGNISYLGQIFGDLFGPRFNASVPLPQYRANTAPYFHDNSAETLLDAVDLYSRFILPFFAPLNLPAVLPPENGGFFPESLTPEQKADLMAFLQIL